MRTNELMINDRVIIVKDDNALKLRVIGIGSKVILKKDTGEKISVDSEDCKGILVTESELITYSFIKKEIRDDSSFNKVISNDYRTIIEDPNKPENFFVLTVEKFGDESWKLKIQDSNYQEISSGIFKYTHELQNLIRINTSLELHV